MRNDRDETWDSYSEDPFEGLDREEWDEEDWEDFLARQDALNAKYEELYETLHDHPERDELIAREMHWNLPDEVAEGPPEDDEPLDGDEEDALADLAASDDLASIPAYDAAQEFALAVEESLVRRLGERSACDEDACQASRTAEDIPSKIAGGHGIGYERDSLCGNIVCCKRALASVHECLDSLLSLRKRGVLPPAEADALLRRGRDVGEAMARRIEELRSRVWWR